MLAIMTSHEAIAIKQAKESLESQAKDTQDCIAGNDKSSIVLYFLNFEVCLHTKSYCTSTH